MSADHLSRAVIIHAVGDLITPPNTVYKFWRVSPVECLIFWVGVLVTIFTTIEDGIYVTIAVSGGLLLFRIAKARGQFLGKVKVHFLVGDDFIDPDTAAAATFSRKNIGSGSGSGQPSAAASSTNLDVIGNTVKSPNLVSYGAIDSVNPSSRHVFLPIDHRDGSNPTIEVVNPYPGVFVYRFSEGFLYANASHYTEALVAHVIAETRPGNPDSTIKKGDRPWNDPGPYDVAGHAAAEARRPTLKAIVLDFSSVNNVDVTSVQNLLDVRNQLDRYATPEAVEWHFASINNRWTKRALTSAGFGFPSDVGGKKSKEGWVPLFSVAEIGVSSAGGGGKGLSDEIEREIEKAKGDDPEAGRHLTNSSERRRKVVPVHSIGRPFFHVDLEGAVESAVRNAKS
jgi:sodium-independent sulfate anion transporter 11